MKNFISIITTAICTLMLFSTILYTSCKKEPCGGICENGGVCKNGSCECLIYYEGEHCEIKRDPCKHNLCQNGATCTSGKCQCPTGATGEYCETLSRKRFISDWEGTDYCNSQMSSMYTIRIEADATPTGVRLYNIRNKGFNIAIAGAFTSNDNIRFKDQNIGNGETLTGDMSFSDTLLQFSYTIIGTNSAENCSAGYRAKHP